MELVKHNSQLPTKLEDLTKFVLIGREKLNSVRAEIRAINKLGLAKEVREQKRDEAQMLAGALLDAESKIGEIIKKIPKDNPEKANRTQGRIASVKELGFTQKQSEQFQQLAENKEIVEQVKAEAIENEDLPTRTEVLNRIKSKNRTSEIQSQKEAIGSLKNIDGLFDTIVVDPPWAYERDYNPKSSRVASPYPEMQLKEIAEIKLPAKDDCVLWLWTTHKFLPESFGLLKKWGFDYKATLIWNKEKIGMGYWLRMQCEFCLLAIKGSPIWDNKIERDIISTPRGGHSAKPDVFYEMVNRICTGNKLDYFARVKRKSWSVYGLV